MPPAEWEQVSLNAIIERLDSGVSVNAEDRPASSDEVGVLKVSAVSGGHFYPEENKAVVATDRDKLSLSACRGDILIGRANTFDLIGASGYVEADCPNLFLPDKLWKVILREPNRDCPKWLIHLLNAPAMRAALCARASGTSGSMKNISKDSFLGIPVLRPPKAEQEQIGTILDSWTEAIRHLQQLLKLKRRLRRGLTQQLLTGQRRFPEFADERIPMVRLGEVMEKAAEPVIPTPEKMYRQIGVRSHGKGLFHKPAVTGTSLGSKRVFRVVPGCLTLNIIFAWERALGLTTKREAGMIASHRFPMFRADPSKALAEYALLYLLSDRGVTALKLASPGGAGRNRTLNQEQFLKTAIPLPTLAEQRKITAVLATADREIDLLEQQLAALREQKKGLMQKLLTGKVRVRI